MGAPITASVDILAGFSKSVSKSGKAKAIVNFTVSNPLILNLDASAIVAEFANEVLEDFKRQLRDIPEQASPQTIARRERRVRQWNTGERTPPLTRRFTGGKTGETPPLVSPRLLFESGRLANGLTLRARTRSTGEAVLTMNVPANRFTTRDFGTEAQLEQYVFDRLRKHVSYFRGASSETNATLDRATRRAQLFLVSTSVSDSLQKTAQALRAIQQLLGALGSFGA